MNRKRRFLEDKAISHRDAWRPLLIAALILSLIAHWYLRTWAKGVTVERPLAPIEEKTVKPTFKVERVDITPRVKQPKPEKVATAELQPSQPDPQRIPEEKVSFEKMMGDEDKGEDAPEENIAPALTPEIGMESKEAKETVKEYKK